MRVRISREVALVLGLGLVARAILIPITHGQDFTVWDLAAQGTLDGTNVYAHHPAYPGGPYAYLPLFIYLELPFRWLATHSGASFVILGKLPILAGDVALGLLVAAELRSRGERRAALGAALVLLNPLVLYNSAYYGRFDTIGCAFLLGAVRALRRHSAAGKWWYALAVVAKTFPAFVLPGVLRQAGPAWRRLLIATIALTVLVSLPYLGSLHAYIHDIVFYDAHKIPQGLTWQKYLPELYAGDGGRVVSYAMLAAFVAASIALCRVVDLEVYVPMALVAFVLCSKVVLEQYLLWPLAFVVLVALTRKGATAVSAVVIYIVYTLVGSFANELYHPFGRAPVLAVVLVVGTGLGYLFVTARAGVVESRCADTTRLSR